MQIIENCSGDQLIPFATNNITPESRVATDGWKGYNGLEVEGYVHHKVLQSKVEDKASVLPGIHLIAFLVNRIMLGTFHVHFDSKYLQRYLDEYVYRFNRRVTKTVGKRFWRIMQQAAASAPIRKLDLTMPTVNVATT
jgi:transposase-like protein